ncbi:ATP-binding cassette domain-containing protein [Leucobacter luti]|uniref:Peptide/nickel transport system permease protein n=1 Tax=Leucobacter luti TaxID=340320 RepID=A0A4Q7U2S2_9MICO|nr:ATP-binding cassette domain-containing protein [Leucobacter luti]RZT66542.1 peptide/nickel transport system permease protein [Leucobacter luti]
MNAWRRALASPAFVAGAILTAALVAVAVFAPALAPADPAAQDLTGGLLPPSPEHWFGTDQLGRDVLSRMLFAARTDLGLAAIAALAPFVIGVTVGMISGYFGGATDWVASRVTDTVIAFPFYVLVIAIVFAVGAGPGGIVIAFALVGWVGYARVLRAMTAALRESGWVQAARGGGLSHTRVLLRHVLPNVLPQAIVLLATEIVLIMVAIVTLGYLGLGIQPPTPDWGTMIADAQQFVTTHWWLPTFPGLAVVVTGIALSLLGDGIGDALRVGVRPRRAPRGGAARRTGASASQRAGTRRRGRASAVVSGPAGADPAGAGPGSVSPGSASAGSASPGSASPGSIGSAGAEPAAVLPAGAVRVRGLRIVASGSSAAGEPAAPLVADLDLDVAPGAALGIVGESGSGKSLTLRALLGMPPTGVTITAGELAVGGRVGMVFQDPLTALDPLTRVGTQLREAVAAGAVRGAAGSDPAGRVRELLAAVQLPDIERIARSYPHQLSGGQRQRVVIALALAGDPAVLLCDEPTTALDVTVQRGVLALLDELRRTRGLTLVFVSHDLAVVAGLCDDVVVMHRGRVVETGETAALVRAPRSDYTRGLLAAVPRLPSLVGDAAADRPPAATDTDPAPTAGRPPETDPAPEVGSLLATGQATAPAPAPDPRLGSDQAPDSHLPPGSPAPAPVLELRDASIAYGRAVAVRDAAFAIPAGAALGIVGESGSGKTTLARAVAGQLGLAGGTLSFAGVELGRRRTPAQLRAIQLMPQDPYSSLNPRRTVGQTLGELLRVHRTVPRTEAAARISELLERVRLDPALAAAYPHELSGGQRQRVALARALAVEPRVLVADEPTSALDVGVQASIIELLRELQRELGLTLLLVSHDLAVVHELCDRVIVMRSGAIVESAGRDFFAAPASAYGRELIAAVPRLP